MTVRAVQVRGPFRGTTGYDHHVREFVRALVHQGVAVQLLDLPEWTPSRLPTTADDATFDELSRPGDASVSLPFCIPHQVVPAPGMAIVNYTMFEATGIHPAWARRAHEIDLTVLPTESSRTAW